MNKEKIRKKEKRENERTREGEMIDQEERTKRKAKLWKSRFMDCEFFGGGRL